MRSHDEGVFRPDSGITIRSFFVPHESESWVSGGTMRRRCNRESAWRRIGITSFAVSGVQVLRQPEPTAKERRGLRKIAQPPEINNW